jgi:hypothetical protein
VVFVHEFSEDVVTQLKHDVIARAARCRFCARGELQHVPTGSKALVAEDRREGTVQRACTFISLHTRSRCVRVVFELSCAMLRVRTSAVEGELLAVEGDAHRVGSRGAGDGIGQQPSLVVATGIELDLKWGSAQVKPSAHARP